MEKSHLNFLGRVDEFKEVNILTQYERKKREKWFLNASHWRIFCKSIIFKVKHLSKYRKEVSKIKRNCDRFDQVKLDFYIHQLSIILWTKVMSML